MELTLVKEDLKPEYQLLHPSQVTFDMFNDRVQIAIANVGHASFIAAIGPGNSPSRAEILICVPENRKIPDPPPAGNCSHPECPLCDGIEVECIHKPPAEPFTEREKALLKKQGLTDQLIEELSQLRAKRRDEFSAKTAQVFNRLGELTEPAENLKIPGDGSFLSDQSPNPQPADERPIDGTFTGPQLDTNDFGGQPPDENPG